MRALIDGDILLYKVGYSTQEETPEYATEKMNERISSILDYLQATDYSVYLSCHRVDSFRAKLNPDYKAHRSREKPVHYAILKQHLIDKWDAVVAEEEEADDLIGIALTSDKDAVACTIDKDILYGLEGHKFNFDKGTLFYTSPEEALFFFYQQLLMGDKSDNIFGIAGIGPAKSAKILDGYEINNMSLFTAVLDYYRDYLQVAWADRFNTWTMNEEKAMFDMIVLSGKQLKIRTHVGEIWQPPYIIGDDGVVD